MIPMDLPMNVDTHTQIVEVAKADLAVVAKGEKFDRVLAICRLTSSITELHSATNVIDPVVEARVYFANEVNKKYDDYRMVGKTLSISAPSIGTLSEPDINGTYLYAAPRNFAGDVKLKATLEFQGYKVKLFYTIKVIPFVVGGGTGEYERACGMKKLYKRLADLENTGSSDYSAWLQSANLSAMLANASAQFIGYANLSSAAIGTTTGTGLAAQIQLDNDAAGHGWYVDTGTPLSLTLSRRGRGDEMNADYLPALNALYPVQTVVVAQNSEFKEASKNLTVGVCKTIQMPEDYVKETWNTIDSIGWASSAIYERHPDFKNLTHEQKRKRLGIWEKTASTELIKAPTTGVMDLKNYTFTPNSDDSEYKKKGFSKHHMTFLVKLGPYSITERMVVYRFKPTEMSMDGAIDKYCPHPWIRKISQYGEPNTQDPIAWLQSANLSAMLANASAQFTGYAALPSSAIGTTTGSGLAAQIQLDNDAAGYGWYVDAGAPLSLTPTIHRNRRGRGDEMNADYLPTSDPTVWKAKAGSAAAGRDADPFVRWSGHVPCFAGANKDPQRAKQCLVQPLAQLPCSPLCHRGDVSTS